MTALSDFYGVVRLILGDQPVHGVYKYLDADISGAVKSVFRLGRSPDGYGLSSENITPDLPDGDAYALIAYEACLLLVGGEDGALAYRTRGFMVQDAGHRKRDLLLELNKQLHEIRNGDSVFTTMQSLMQFLNSYQTPYDEVQVKLTGHDTQVTL